METMVVRVPKVRMAAYHARVESEAGYRRLSDIKDPRSFGREGLSTIKALAKANASEGFRVIMRVGEDGGQLPGAPLAIEMIGGEVLRTTLRKEFDPAAIPAPSNVNEKPDDKCVFDKFVSGAIPVTPVLNEDGVFVTTPKENNAKEHYLFLPTTHWRDLTSVTDPEYFGTVFTKIVDFANKDVFARGFQLISNNGPWGLQAVPHLHFHMLGGEKLESPFWQDWQK
jgi:histidine triad (HIT) family protein